MSDTHFKLAAVILLAIQASIFVVSTIYELILSKRFYDRLEKQRKNFEKKLTK